MRKVIITITLSMAVVAGTQLPVRAGTNFEGPNYHWESAYNHTDPYAQTLRAFAVHDRTNNPAFQANIYAHVRQWNDTRAKYNMGLPWEQLFTDSNSPCYQPASGEATVCMGSSAQVGSNHTGITSVNFLDAGTGYGYHIHSTLTLINNSKNWSDNTLRQNVICHELGHAAGLGEGADGASCMWPVQTRNTWYGNDDNYTLNLLYAHAPNQ